MVNNNTSSFAYVKSPESLKECLEAWRPLQAISEAPANPSRLLDVEGAGLGSGGPLEALEPDPEVPELWRPLKALEVAKSLLRAL